MLAHKLDKPMFAIITWFTAPAAVALQCPLRRALLSADPRLRHGGRPSRGHDPAVGQDALRHRGARSCPPSRPGDPPPLADNPHHHPRRRPLLPARGDGLVRGARRRLQHPCRSAGTHPALRCRQLERRIGTPLLRETQLREVRGKTRIRSKNNSRQYQCLLWMR